MLSLIGIDAQAYSVVKLYLDSIGENPLLTQAEEAELSRRIHAGDQAARDELTRRNLPLAVDIASRYQGQNVSMPDLIQEANIGLMRAVEKFDGSLGWKFSTYATWWIRQHVRRAIEDQGHAIRIPVHMQERLRKFRRTQAELTQALGRHPTQAEVVAAAGLGEAEWQTARDVPDDPCSLDAPIVSSYAEDPLCLADLVADAEESVEDQADHDELKERVASALVGLNERERWVIVRRYGLDGERPATLEALGKAMGISRERVRQLETKAIRHLRATRACRKLRSWA